MNSITFRRSVEKAEAGGSAWSQAWGGKMSAQMRFLFAVMALVGLCGCPASEAAEVPAVDGGRFSDAEQDEGGIENAGDATAPASGDDAGDAASEEADAATDDAAPQGCTSCHGGENPAPPVDLEGHTDTTFPGVGAHQAHLRGTPWSRAVLCSECHVVPENAPGPLDQPRPAQVTFSGVAMAFETAPIYADGVCSNTACHGGRGPTRNPSGAANPTPAWTKVDGTQAVCGACHGLPPPPPHPDGPLVCAGCHMDVAEDFTFLRPERHVDGLVTFTLPP